MRSWEYGNVCLDFLKRSAADWVSEVFLNSLHPTIESRGLPSKLQVQLLHLCDVIK